MCDIKDQPRYSHNEAMKIAERLGVRVDAGVIKKVDKIVINDQLHSMQKVIENKLDKIIKLIEKSL